MKRFLKAIRNPSRILRVIFKSLYTQFFVEDHVGAIGKRSLSDIGPYIASVKKATSSYENFLKFKLNPDYQLVLEHATKEQGESYLERIRTDSPSLLTNFSIFKENDSIGGAKTFRYPEVGEVSPSTL